jgi:hypothetical protein
MLATAFANAASNAKETTIVRDYDETIAPRAPSQDRRPYHLHSSPSTLVASGVTFK